MWQLLLPLAFGTFSGVLARPLEAEQCETLQNPGSCTAAGLDKLKFAVLGDSWASGVAYSAGTQYDDNKTGCLRLNDAYAVQMKNNENWATHPEPALQFSACSGSRLVDIVQGNCQICQLDNPDLIIMTISGNDVGFGKIAENCIYQPNRNMDYGPDYADDTKRIGLCAESIDKAKYYLETSEQTLEADVKATISDLLDSKLAKENPNLRIYQTGYAQFFNANETWCDTESFGAIPSWIPGSHKPKLSHVLRQDINSLVNEVNTIIRQVTSTYAHQHVGFVDINPAFEGHRFCETGGSHRSQYYDIDTWFWNLSYPWFDQKNTNASTSTDVILDGPLFGSNSSVYANSGNGNVNEGWRFRPFHPTSKGHEAIMNAIIAQLKADKVPGVQS